MRMKRIFSLIFVFVFMLAQFSLAADDRTVFDKEAFIESAGTNKVLKIGLIDCITYALKNNSEIKIKGIEPRLKEDAVRIALSDFEPTFSAGISLEDTRDYATSSLAGSSTRSSQLDLGVEGKLITGTEYSLDLLNKKYESNSSYQSPNPYYQSDPQLTITQPLFKDFGVFVNSADIKIAQNNLQQSKESFKNEVMDIVSNAKIAYYNYIFYLEQYVIAESSLRRAGDLLEINKERYSKGLISSIDLLETETAESQRKKTLISTESSVKRAEDELKLITNLIDDPGLWNANIELIDKPKCETRKINLVPSIENAFKYRPDYEEKRIDLENRDIKIKVAKNALLPTLDLIGSFGLNGLGEDYGDCIDKIDSEHKDWSVGLKLSVPWGDGERASYDQKKLEKVQALIAFKRLEQNIILEVRDRVREVDIQYRQVVTSGLSKEKEKKHYEAQRERYSAGQVSTHDMLDYQDRLAQAELDYIKALVDYNIAIINLEKSEGVTLLKENIELVNL